MPHDNRPPGSMLRRSVPFSLPGRFVPSRTVKHTRTYPRLLHRPLRTAAPLFLLTAGLMGCGAARQLPSRSDSLMAAFRLNNAVTDYWRFIETSRPELAVRADVVVTRMPDPTQDRTKRDAQFARSLLGELDRILVDGLAEDDYVTWLSLRWEMESLDGSSAFHWTNLSDLAPGRSVFDRAIEILNAVKIGNPETGQRFLGLVTAVGGLARAVHSEFELRARREIRLTQPAAQRAITLVRNLIAPAAASPFALPRDFLASPDTAWHTRLVRDVATAITEKVNPPLDSLAAFLERERDRAPDSLGLSRLPGGAAHYAALLRYRTTLEVTPEEAHAIGLREVARIAPLAAAARDEARLPANRDSLRQLLMRDSVFVIDDRVSLPERAARLLGEFAKSLDTLFGPAPPIPVTIGIIPIKAEAQSPISVYEPPTLAEPSARYLLNSLQLEARSGFMLPAMVIADLMPGRHLQQATQFQAAVSSARVELEAVRSQMHHDGFVRGWQSYALHVADSLSRALTPSQRYSVRLRELAAACGLVVDTGIHALGWSQQNALAFLRAYLPDDDAWLEREFIFEAIESPGTLAAATLGARELRGLRRWAMRELGDRFSLAAFHREVLRTGSVPLPILGTHLERWIWELKNPPVPRPGARR